MNAEQEIREELLSVLHELTAAMPDMRFGQLVVNLSYFAREPSDSCAVDVEDEELLSAARHLLARQHEADSLDPTPAVGA